MIRMLCIAAAALIALGGCSTMSRSLSYGNRWADARLNVEHMEYSYWLHPRDPTVLITLSTGSALARGSARGATFGLADVNPVYQQWMAGAQALVAPVGCDVTELTALDQLTTWEFTPVCPDGVDLRAVVAAQRDALRAGAQLQR